jgi:hypothetical protein
MSTLLANTAIDLAIAALLTAVAVAVTNAAGYIAVRTRLAAQGAHISDLQQHQQDASTSATTPTMVVTPIAAGGALAPVSVPVYNQLNDPLPDGAQDPYATTDCGEESVAMVIAACGGPPLPAGVLRQLLGGVARPGATTAANLVYLLSLFKVLAHVRQADPDAAWTEWQHAQGASFPVIALGYWVSAGYPHWIVIRACDALSITYNDPWGGHEQTMTKGTAQMRYMGYYVHVDQAVSAPAPGPA